MTEFKTFQITTQKQNMKRGQCKTLLRDRKNFGILFLNAAQIVSFIYPGRIETKVTLTFKQLKKRGGEGKKKEKSTKRKRRSRESEYFFNILLTLIKLKFSLARWLLMLYNNSADKSTDPTLVKI